MLSILPCLDITWVIVCWVKGGCGWRTLWWSRSGPAFQTDFPSRCSPAWTNRKIFNRSFICTVYSSWTKIWTTLRRWECYKSNVRADQESIRSHCNHRVMWSSTRRILLTVMYSVLMICVCVVLSDDGWRCVWARWRERCESVGLISTLLGCVSSMLSWGSQQTLSLSALQLSGWVYGVLHQQLVQTHTALLLNVLCCLKLFSRESWACSWIHILCGASESIPDLTVIATNLNP